MEVRMILHTNFCEFSVVMQW